VAVSEVSINAAYAIDFGCGSLSGSGPDSCLRTNHQLSSASSKDLEHGYSPHSVFVSRILSLSGEAHMD